MPTFRTAAKRFVRPVIASSSIAALAVTSFSFQSPVSAEQGQCAPGADERVLEWSDNSDPARGAVWSPGINQFDMGDGLSVTASLVDSGPVDEASTLQNSGLLAQATPDADGALVWNLNTTTLADNASSTLLFEFSVPVESFTVVAIDVDAKSAEANEIGWHDEIAGIANGENVSIGMAATDPSRVTIDGSSAWAADGVAKSANESPAGNVTVSATGTLFSAGLSYSDGIRSMSSPERHAIGISSISVCLVSDGGSSISEAAPTTLVSPEIEADGSLDQTTSTTTTETATAEPPTTENQTATAEPPTTENQVGEEATTTPTTAPDTTTTSELEAELATIIPESSVTETTDVPDVEQTTSGLLVTTTASEPVSNGGDSYSFGYTITAVNNDDDTTLESVQLVHDLQNALEDAKAWQVDNVAAVEGACVASDSYDGGSNTELLLDTVDLAPNASCSMTVAVTVTPAQSTQQFEVSGSASAIDSSSNGPTISESATTAVETSPETKTLAFTGTESEDIAVSGALLLILGATLISYCERFLFDPTRVPTASE